MRLRSKLARLSVGTVVPLIILATLMGALLINAERDAMRRIAIDRNRAFTTAVDAEVRGHMLSLAALAASKTLEANDLAGFRAEATRIFASQPDWQNIVLLLPSGQQVVSIMQPSSARLRDYYRVEDGDGRRYWIYREGLIGDGRGGAPNWFMHGLFG